MLQLSRLFTLLSLFVLQIILSPQLQAQELDYVQGDLLIQLKPDTDGERWLQSWNIVQPAWLQVDKIEVVARPADIWLLKFDYTQIEDKGLLRAIQQASEVLTAQFNHSVKLRGEPSDLLFDEQWQYQNTGQSGGTVGADIDAVEAWDVTTGGTTLAGDTIVVAVLDNGIDRDHNDFQRNRWYNHAEIPDNGMDDDNNGYTDDYEGWSTVTNNDNIAGGGHGTSVSGIIGADGDNALGVTGVNWYVKVMHIRNNFNTNEAKVLEAYSYAWEQRLAYNASGGTEGAFVVATNASWGINEGNPENFPLWCAFYDTMGEAGILNCGATANADLNVDEVGDMPTACPSDHLLTVTNTNHNDNKVTQAGYGATTIDLGAPGSGAYTLTNGSGYGSFGGTSGATPHLAGTIALLYSIDCPTLVELTQSDPPAASQLIKQAIMESVDPNSSLQDITVSGGRLNVNNSVQYMLEICDGCIPATSVRTEDITVDAATILWNTNDSLQSVDLRWRVVGSEEWMVIEGAVSPQLLFGLAACQDYEYQLQSNCTSDTIPFGNSRVFGTDGCCTAPEDIMVEVLSGQAINFAWNPVTAAQSYDIRFRVNGTTDWTTVNASTNSFTLSELETCTIYDYQLRTNCTEENTDWTTLTTVLTGECGPCLDLDYCRPENVLDASQEYIEKVEIGGFFTNTTSGASNGYNDFGQTLAAIEVEAGLTYPIQLTPGFAGGDPFLEAWRVWLDTDHNGSFTSNEVIFEADGSLTAVTGSITIPVTANLGITRMRVLMRFSTATEACPFLNGFGEVEDYCVNILPSSICPIPSNFTITPLSFTEVTISWDPIAQALDYVADYRANDDIEWNSATVTGNSVSLSQLDSCQNYTLRVKTLCNGDDSELSLYQFDTCDDPNSTNEIRARQSQWRVLPNPFREYFEVRISEEAATEPSSVVIYDALGRNFLRTAWPRGQRQLQIEEVAQLPAGVYTIGLLRNGQLWSSRRIVKQD